MEIGINSFAGGLHAAGPAAGPDRSRAAGTALAEVLARAERADQVGLDVFGLGEHYRAESLNSAPSLILAAVAARTRRIRLTSAVTVLSTDDPVRVFQQFATLDLLAQGRAELTVGRGSATEAYPLFGYDLRDYDALFAEKLALLLQLRRDEHPHWRGRFRLALTGQGVYPRPWQPELPVWLGVGGTPASFVRAGTLGLPLLVAALAGEVGRLRPLVDRYREAGHRAGFAAPQLRVGLHVMGHVAATSSQAIAEFLPAYAGLLQFYPDYARALSRRRAGLGGLSAVRALFDEQAGPRGALVVGSPAEVTARLLYFRAALGGLDRVMLHSESPWLPQDQQLRAIELLGSEVAPALRAAP